MNLHSLRAKLAIAFSLVAVSLMALTALLVAELRDLERQIRIERRTTALFDQLREVRNLENRFFLFRRQSLYSELRDEIDRSLARIEDSRAEMAPLGMPIALSELAQTLLSYREQLDRHWRNPRERDGNGATVDESIRDQRRHFIEIAGSLSEAAQAAVESRLDDHRRHLGTGILLMMVMMLFVAHFLIRRIVRPLKSIESQMEQVARGAIGRVDFASGDQELNALGSAFNHVMSELEDRQKAAVQVEKLASLGTMLSGVAHELNNPLSNISTTVQIIGEEIDQISRPELSRRLERIDQQTERARTIVRGLLEYARADSEQFVRIDLQGLVDQAVEAVNLGRAARRLILSTVEAGIQVSGNPERLQRVLINLLDNAIDATPDDQPIMILGSTSSASNGCSGVEIWVQDCGSGMTPAQAEHMFDPFYTTKAAGQGTGLGLFVAHEIIKQHRGSIRVITHAATGTSIGLQLPGVARA